MFPPSRLYAIVDRATLDARGVSAGSFAEELCNAGTKLVQYRDKTGGPQEVLRVAAEIAANNPNRVSRLALINPLGLWRDDTPIKNYMVTPQADLGKLMVAEVSRDALSAPAPGEAALLARCDGDDPVPLRVAAELLVAAARPTLSAIAPARVAGVVTFAVSRKYWPLTGLVGRTGFDGKTKTQLPGRIGIGCCHW